MDAVREVRRKLKLWRSNPVAALAQWGATKNVASVASSALVWKALTSGLDRNDVALARRLCQESALRADVVKMIAGCGDETNMGWLTRLVVEHCWWETNPDLGETEVERETRSVEVDRLLKEVKNG